MLFSKFLTFLLKNGRGHGDSNNCGYLNFVQIVCRWLIQYSEEKKDEFLCESSKHCLVKNKD